MIPFRRKLDPHMLAIGMAGVKMGNQIAQIGCANGGRLGAIAAKVGLSGRAVAIVPEENAAARATKGAAAAGVLVDVEIAPPTRLPLDANAFDLVIIDDSGGLLATLSVEERGQAVREALRILKPGSRVMVIGAAPRDGFGTLFRRSPSGPPFDAKPLLEGGGFKFARVLGEREGLRFLEALKPR
jgi:ubiquinone/menaquinone biosynthesis C-methylase UbiE